MNSESTVRRLLANGLVLPILLLSMALAPLPARAADPPPLRSAAEIGYPPFSFADAHGKAGGFSVELLRAAMAAMGRSVVFRVGPWSEVKGWLAEGEVQALPLVGRTPEREPLFDFTFPYMSLHGAIVVRDGETGIRNLGDLRGRRVAVMRKDNAEEFLLREDRGIEIHATTTFEQALRELSEGRHDAVVIQRLLALRLIQETGLANLRIVARPIEGFRQDFCFAVRDGDRETLSLLNEGLALVMANGTYRRLHAKWFAALELPVGRRIVVGGDRDFPPFEYLDENGHPAGFNVDLTRAIAREMGLDIEIRLGPWTEIVRGLEDGEIDVIQGIFYSPERDRKFDFSPAHSVNHYVAATRPGEAPPPSELEALRGRHVAVQRGDIFHDFLLENQAEERFGIRIVALGTQVEALEELAAGRHDLAIAGRLTALHWLRNRDGSESPLVVGRRPLLSLEYCYAVLNGRKALLAQFSEGLNLLEETGEYRRIREKWIGVHEDVGIGLDVILNYAVGIGAPLLAILLASLAWSWTLRRQVALRTEALRESEAGFRSLVEGAPDAIFVQTDFRFAYANPAALRLFGAESPEQILDQPVMDRFHPSVRDMVRDRIRKLNFEKKKAPPVEQIYLRLDGSEVSVEVSAVPMVHEGRDGALVFARDIADRKESERALRESEALFRNLFDGHAAVKLLIEAKTGRIIDANRAAAQFYGWSRERLREMDIQDINTLSDDEVAQAISQARFRKRIYFEFRHRRADGSVRDVEVYTSEIQVGGRALLHSIVHDVTERKRVEEQFRQAQKMESVGRLAGGVAHDFNNMLGVIIGNAEMALEETEPDSPIAADIEEILRAAKRSADITRQLLAFARKQTIQPRTLDMNETVEGMLKMLRRLIGEDIDLIWHPGSELWPVRMDPAQLDQVLANLCVNARDAIGGVGKVTIETDNAVFDEAYCEDHIGFVPGEYARLAVSDDGCGMEKEVRDRIFEPFFTTKAADRGTGLGLPTVYGIAKQNGGFVNVYSEPGKGTAFRIYFPRWTGGESGDEAPASAPEIARGRGETILLVEDEPAILKMCAAMLEKLGYRVLAAPTPGEAERLAEAGDGTIRLLLTDVVMPEMNGRDLADRLGKRFPNLRVLFMSGYTANAIAHRGVLDAGVHFIQKPFSMEALGAAVESAMGTSEGSAPEESRPEITPPGPPESDPWLPPPGRGR
jgi:PAS domain S-box-containing protein